MSRIPYIGGLHPDTQVRVIPAHGVTTEPRKLSEVRPGEYLEGCFESSYWRVDEVVTFRRKLRSYEIDVEAGPSLIASQGTLICAQYGPRLISESLEDPYCFVDFTFHHHDNRRRFSAELKNADSADRSIVRYFSGGSRKLDSNTKSYYFYNELIAFLHRLREKWPNIRIIAGCDVSHSYSDEVYDLRHVWKSRDTFFPLLPIRTLQIGDTKHDLAYVALFDGASTFRPQYRKVTRIRSFDSDGPWCFPIFDSHHHALAGDVLYGEFVRQRFVFPANNIPVFYPCPYFSFDIGQLTLPLQGQDIYPQQPPKSDYGDLRDIYSELLRNKSHVFSKSTNKNKGIIHKLYDALDECSRRGLSEDDLTAALEAELKSRRSRL